MEQEGLLSPDELDRIAWYRLDRDRIRFGEARGWLRRILGSALNCNPRELQFESGLFGKPHLTVPAGSGLHFNLSHSHGHAVVALAWGREIGINVEQIRPLSELDAMARDQFSPEEFSSLAALTAHRRITGFFRIWTRKEAYIKATGVGLSEGLKRFSVNSTVDFIDHPSWVRDGARPHPDWWVRDIPAPNGFCAAVCQASSPLRLELFGPESGDRTR